MEEEYNKFRNGYLEKIEQYYLKLKDKKQQIYVRFLIILLVFETIFCFTDHLFFKDFNVRLFVLVIGTIINILTCFLAMLKNLKKEKRCIVDDIILDMVRYISKDEKSVFKPYKMISKDVISKMELFDLRKLKYSGKNIIQANYNNNPMSFADVDIYFNKTIEHDETHYDKQGNKKVIKVKEKVKKYVFNGCYISAQMNKNIKEHIYLIPNNISDLLINGKIKDYITYNGDEVKLENIEFSNNYKVYSNNEVCAREVLTSGFVEKILNIDNVWENKKFIVFKNDGKLAICMQGFSIEKLRKTNIPNDINSLKLEDSLKSLFKKIYNLFSIYNILDLGNYVDRT